MPEGMPCALEPGSAAFVCSYEGIGCSAILRVLLNTAVPVANEGEVTTTTTWP